MKFSQLLSLLRSGLTDTRHSAGDLVEAVLQTLPIEGSPDQAEATAASAEEITRITDLLEEVRAGLKKIEAALQAYGEKAEERLGDFPEVFKLLQLNVRLLATHLDRSTHPRGAGRAPIPQTRLTTFLSTVNAAGPALDRADPLALIRTHLADLRGRATPGSLQRIWTDSDTKTAWLDGTPTRVQNARLFRAFSALAQAHNEGRTPITASDLALEARLREGTRIDRLFRDHLPEALTALLQVDDSPRGGYALALPPRGSY